MSNPEPVSDETENPRTAAARLILLVFGSRVSLGALDGTPIPREAVAELVAESWATQLSEGMEAGEQFSRMVAAADEVTEIALQVGYHLGRARALAEGSDSPGDLEEWVEALRLLNLMLDAARGEAE